MFLSGPLAPALPDPVLFGDAAEHLFQARRGSPKADAEVGMLIHRKCEVELPLEPSFELAHRGSWVFPRTRIASSTRLQPAPSVLGLEELPAPRPPPVRRPGREAAGPSRRRA